MATRARLVARAALALSLVTLLSVPPAVAVGPSGPSGSSQIQRVRMVDSPRNRFRPVTITVSAGTRIRWSNVGDDRHSTKSRDNLWDSGLLDPGERFTRRFRQRGTFRYFCTIHPEMVGTVVVT